MEVICKPKYNSIFWRENANEDWDWTELDDMIHDYIGKPRTRLDYAWPVRKAGTDEILYYVYFCRACDECVITVDPNPGYKYCPHCGTPLED